MIGHYNVIPTDVTVLVTGVTIMLLPKISLELQQLTLQPCSSRTRASANHIVIPPARSTTLMVVVYIVGSATRDEGLATHVVKCRQ